MDSATIKQHVSSVYDAFAAGDLDRYRSRLADDIVWHVPGALAVNPVAGNYRGLAEYGGTMVGRMQPLDEWRLSVLSILVNEADQSALVAFHVVGARKDKRVDMDGYHVVRVNDDGKIAEGWGFTEDQASLDRFFSA